MSKKRAFKGIPTKVCRRTGKLMYFTQTAAERAVITMWGKKADEELGNLHSYYCKYCKSWHIGHRRQNDSN